MANSHCTNLKTTIIITRKIFIQLFFLIEMKTEELKTVKRIGDFPKMLITHMFNFVLVPKDLCISITSGLVAGDLLFIRLNTYFLNKFQRIR